MDSFKVAM
jgi:hypothetical protein